MLLLLFAKASVVTPPPAVSGGADGETSRRKRIRPPFILSSPRLVPAESQRKQRRNLAIILAISH